MKNDQVLPLDQLSKAWEDFADRLLLIARSFGESGEDAVQEAFMALSRQQKMPDEPLAWVVKVARNQVLQWNRSEQRRTRRHVVCAKDTAWFEKSEQESIDVLDVTEALKMLPADLSEVVTMHYPEPFPSDTPSWLSQLRPSSASSLQASVFYHAGYEAARRELGKTAWQRATLVAVAASVIIVTGSGALLLTFDKPIGLGIPGRSVSEGNAPVAPDKSRELRSQIAYAAPPSSIANNNQPILPAWLQSQFQRALPTANAPMNLLGPGVELGQIGADWDKIIVLKSPANFDNAGNTVSQSNQSLEKPKPIEPQTLRSMRDDQIKSLLERLF